MKIKDEKFTIDQICFRVDMNKRKVRYYIQKGLVSRPEGIGRAAVYSHIHLEQLQAIQKWKAAGLSLERIQDILADEKSVRLIGKPLPPFRPIKQGDSELWRHINVDDGIELHIEPNRAGLSPDQVRLLFREVIGSYKRIRKGKL